MRLNDGGSYPYGFGWMLDPVRGHSRVGHTGAWQGFRTSLERFPDRHLAVIVLANLAEAEPRAIALAVAGLLEPSIVPPHRLASPLPGPRPPVPVNRALAALSDDSSSTLLTPGLRRFLSAASGASGASSASALERGRRSAAIARPGRSSELGAETAWWCYARGTGPTAASW